MVWKYLQMKTRFSALQMVKNIFFKNMFLMVCKYAQMQQNTFLPLQTKKNIFFLKHVSNGLVVCANASKRILTSPDVKKYIFLKNFTEF